MKLFEEFQQFRKILCICPCCNELSRVSDLKLKIKGREVKTWLDKFDKRREIIDRKEEKFREIESELRKKSVEKGRMEAQKSFNKAISPDFKALKFDPFDIKPILNPIDFVVFKGMNKIREIKEIIFLSQQLKNPALNKIRIQVKNSIQKKKYHWQVARINERGVINLE